MDMVERVAKALFDDYQKSALGPDLTQTWATLPKIAIDHAYSQAREAIAAMREPTEEMVTAGEGHTDRYDSEEDDFLNGWRAAIDAALECSTKQTEK